MLGAAVAMSTQRVAIRAGSVVAPLHHPARIAEEWSVVDNLSGGRAGYCEKAAESGGATPVVDGEPWLNSLRPEVREAFADGIR